MKPISKCLPSMTKKVCMALFCSAVLFLSATAFGRVWEGTRAIGQQFSAEPQTKTPQESPKSTQDRFAVPDVTAPKTERMVDVGGRKLHARLYGHGSPTVVFVTGTGNAPQETWNPLIDPLAAEATLITYDRAGIGKSEIGDLPTHAKQSAVDLRRLLKELNAPKPILFVGHSYGVRVVKLFASLFPDEVGGLVLMDGVPPTILEAQKKILTGADLERLEKMTSVATAPPNPRTEMDHSLESLEQERQMGPLPHKPTLVLIAGANREAGVPPGFSPEARRKMAQLGIDLQRKMAADLGGEFIVFDDLSHYMHLEKPAPIIQAIKDMIHKLRAGFPTLNGPYLGQKRPGATPEIFAPGILSLGFHEHNIAISPDGRYLFFGSFRNFQPIKSESPDYFEYVKSRLGAPSPGKGTLYWMKAKVIDALRPKDKNDVQSVIPRPGIYSNSRLYSKPLD